MLLGSAAVQHFAWTAAVHHFAWTLTVTSLGERSFFGMFFGLENDIWQKSGCLELRKYGICCGIFNVQFLLSSAAVLCAFPLVAEF